MTDAEILRLNPAQLARQAKFLGLRLTGQLGRKVWSMRKSITDRTHRERPLKFATHCAEADLRTAILRASRAWENHVEKVHGSSALPTLRTPGGWASFNEIEAHYLRAASCAPFTRKKNFGRLRRMVSLLFPDRAWAELDAGVLDGRLVRNWQLAQKESAEAAYLPANPAACERAKRGANAIYRQARSVFSAKLLRSYADAGLRLPPGVLEFARQGYLDAAKAPKSQQLTPANVAQISRLMPRLRIVRPGIWAALLLMFRGGLRNSEAVKARWDWLVEATDGTWRLTLQTQDDYKPKTEARAVALSAAVVAALRTVRRAEDPHIVPAASDGERAKLCGRRLNKFLRACGVHAVKGKTAYRLRGHAITEIMLLHGFDAAREFAGHTTERTTENYIGERVPYAPLPLPA